MPSGRALTAWILGPSQPGVGPATFLEMREPSTWPGDRAVFEGVWTISGLPSMQAVEVRLRTARRFVREMEAMVAQQTQIPWERPESGPPHTAARQRVEPLVAPGDQEVRRWEEARAELPLLAWATTLGYCFSTLEAFLREAAQDAARMTGRSAAPPRRPPLVEAWIDELERLGSPVRLDARAWDDLRALRRVRNALTHGLALTKQQVPPDLRAYFEASSGMWASPDSFVPTSDLVRRALATVESFVAAVDYALTASGQRQVERWDPMERAWARRPPD